MRYGWSRTTGLLALCTTSLIMTACGGGGGGGTVPQAVVAAANPGNTPPDIAGSAPSAVAVGWTYSYLPETSDPDGDALTYSIRNKPEWASFDSATGKLSGLAKAGTEGTYADITITASDGQLTDSTVFTLEVTQFGEGSITLSWDPPMQNEDGTPLVDLAGYRIYFGTQSGHYGNSVDIGNSGIVTYVIENLSPTTYYFVSTAMNADGVESEFSNEAVRNVRGP